MSTWCLTCQICHLPQIAYCMSYIVATAQTVAVGDIHVERTIWNAQQHALNGEVHHAVIPPW